jgi:hypothetical protein
LTASLKVGAVSALVTLGPYFSDAKRDHGVCTGVRVKRRTDDSATRSKSEIIGTHQQEFTPVILPKDFASFPFATRTIIKNEDSTTQLLLRRWHT